MPEQWSCWTMELGIIIKYHFWKITLNIHASISIRSKYFETHSRYEYSHTKQHVQIQPEYSLVALWFFKTRSKNPIVLSNLATCSFQLKIIFLFWVSLTLETPCEANSSWNLKSSFQILKRRGIVLSTTHNWDDFHHLLTIYHFSISNKFKEWLFGG